MSQKYITVLRICRCKENLARTMESSLEVNAKVDPLHIAKPVRIGIIGGGQLAKMITQVAKRMSIYVIILDPAPNCPTSNIADRQIIADFKDEDAIKQLANNCDILTYEIELGNSDILSELEMNGFAIHPSAETLKNIQDKLLQRQMLKMNNIPVPDFMEVVTREQLVKALKLFGFPAMLKARFDSYDGRGNLLVRSKAQIDEAVKFLMDRKCFLEEYVPFVKEISVMIARNGLGQVVSHPVVENIHRDNILDITIVPARINEGTRKEAKHVAEDSVRMLKGMGIFGVEMFLTKDEKVLINEIAPRPHNSGHYSIEACSISQFEQHIRAILNLPLIEPVLLSPAVMINIIGEDGSDHPYAIEGIKDVLAIPGASLHIYGKATARKGRKLGHITVVDRDVKHAIQKAREARSLIKIKDVSGING
ncbi:MAG: 5-(carboxyamino)imidazole ribonucleotide synthase [Nitrososphaerales archaeon]